MSVFPYMLAAIKGVCEGTLGSVRTVDQAPEYHGASVDNERVQALSAPYSSIFDVVIDNGARHPSSPMSMHSYEVKRHQVRIDIKHALTEEVLEDDRTAVRLAIAEQCEAIVTALNYRGNLSEDADGNATGIVSGLLTGPEGGAPVWEITAEDWDSRLIRSRIRCTAIVQHERAVA